MFPEFSLDLPEACLFWAAATNHIFRLHNIRSEIAAGSMNWPIVPKHLDDGVRPTHFSYEFEPDGRSMILSSYLGCLPEMHIWVQLTDTHEIVDLSLRSLRENYMQLTGNNPHHPPNTFGQTHSLLIPTTEKTSGQPGLRYRH